MKLVVTYQTDVEPIGHVGVEGVKSVTLSSGSDLVVAREGGLDMIWAKGCWVRARLCKDFSPFNSELHVIHEGE